jgi:hypothetical protein
MSLLLLFPPGIFVPPPPEPGPPTYLETLLALKTTEEDIFEVNTAENVDLQLLTTMSGILKR